MATKTKSRRPKEAQRILDVRVKRGENQTAFWGRIGVSQAAGSRIESGQRKTLRPVTLLFDIAYGDANTRKRVLAALQAK